MARKNKIPTALSDWELAVIRQAAERERRTVCGYLRWAALRAAEVDKQATAHDASRQAVPHG